MKYGDRKKNIFRTIGVLMMTALVLAGGGRELSAEQISQTSWRLWQAEIRENGIFVETVGENLMLLPGVRVRADSQEGKDFSPEKVRDGIQEETQLRWSSENDWENNEHWLEADFREPRQVGAVRIYWERTNAKCYALEYAEDGKNWKTLAAFDEPPREKVQDIVLSEAVETRFLRLHVTEVTREEADLSLYYQNVSVLELEAYEQVQDSFLVGKPEITAGSRRQLTDKAVGEGVQAVALPSVPAGYELEFAGADYENLITPEGKIADTLADTEAELGFALVKDGVTWELPGMQVRIPAAAGAGETDGTAGKADVSVAAASGTADLPQGFSAMEWQPGTGTVTVPRQVKVTVVKEAEGDTEAAPDEDGTAENAAAEVAVAEEQLEQAAQLLAREMAEVSGCEAEAVFETGELSEAKELSEAEGQVLFVALSLLSDETRDSAESWTDPLGEEGFEICIGKENGGNPAENPKEASYIQIQANTLQGLRWGCVSLVELMEQTQGKLPCGRLRDYPRYSVRGFGIDVGRRPVSLKFLYQLTEEMSRQKMNTLLVHLNDNQIISQSDYDGTVEGAYSLYAGFRLESKLQNAEGEGITSQDLYYTREAFAQFVADAAVYGVEVVPEIDTPAHSLALTRVFPKLGLTGDPEAADQLDLSKPEAVQLGKALWREYLAESDTFADCDTVHIGMDEYFGDPGAYLSYLTELSDYVNQLAPEKAIRIWGSLSGMNERAGGKLDFSGLSRELQLHIWDTDWADPGEMYEAGFSVINSLSSSLYLIPGGGYDWLDQAFLEEKWQPNVFETAERTWQLPAYSPRMLGACYMMWNDWAHLNGEDITEADLFARFEKPLPVIARKLWGE